MNLIDSLSTPVRGKMADKSTIYPECLIIGIAIAGEVEMMPSTIGNEPTNDVTMVLRLESRTNTAYSINEDYLMVIIWPASASTAIHTLQSYDDAFVLIC